MKLFLVTILMIHFCYIFEGNHSIKNYEAKPHGIKRTTPDSVLIDQYYEKKEKLQYDQDVYKYYDKAIADAEKIRDTALIIRFIPVFLKTFGSNLVGYTPNDLVKFIHTIDLDGDNDLDFIYAGSSGADSDMIVFYLKTKNGYEKVFKGSGFIEKLVFKDRKLIFFSVFAPGCCADVRIEKVDYQVSFVKKEFSIKRQKTVGYVNETEVVTQKFKNPKPFYIIKNRAKLRAETIIFEGVVHEQWGTDGNILELYQEGSKGIAIGSKKSDTGSWLFVLMNPKKKTKKSMFDSTVNIYGWIKREDSNL